MVRAVQSVAEFERWFLTLKGGVRVEIAAKISLLRSTEARAADTLKSSAYQRPITRGELGSVPQRDGSRHRRGAEARRRDRGLKDAGLLTKADLLAGEIPMGIGHGPGEEDPNRDTIDDPDAEDGLEP